MTTKTDLQAQEVKALQELADILCPACGGSGHGDCCKDPSNMTHYLCDQCEGTGRKYFGLSVLCPCIASKGLYRCSECSPHGAGGHCLDCERCGGSNRLPVSVADGLKWLQEERREFVNLARYHWRFENLFEATWKKDGATWMYESGPTPFLALVAAIRAAEEADGD